MVLLLVKLYVYVLNCNTLATPRIAVFDALRKEKHKEIHLRKFINSNCIIYSEEKINS